MSITAPPISTQRAAQEARRPALALAKQAPDLYPRFQAQFPSAPLTAEHLRAALEARGRGCTWVGVAYVMGRYHGVYYSHEHWRSWMQAVGLKPTRRRRAAGDES